MEDNANVDDERRKRKRTSSDSDFVGNDDGIGDSQRMEEDEVSAAAKCGIDKNYTEMMDKDIEKRVMNGETETVELLKRTVRMITRRDVPASSSAVANASVNDRNVNAEICDGASAGIGAAAAAVDGINAIFTSNELDNKCDSINGDTAVQTNEEPYSATTSNITTNGASQCSVFLQLDIDNPIDNSRRNTIITRYNRRARHYRRRTMDSSSPSSTSSELPQEEMTTETATTEIGTNNSNVTQDTVTTANNVTPADVVPQVLADANIANQSSADDSVDENRTLARRLSQDRSQSEVSSPYSDDEDDVDDNDDDDDDDANLIVDDEDDTPEQQKPDKDALLKEVLNKPKPSYTWNSTIELMRREHGLASDGRSSLRPSMSRSFNSRFYSSLHVIERMKLTDQLRKHIGCVNCVNFNRNGDLLCSGSDDTRIIVWDWAAKKPLQVFKSGHTENIFQTKFVNSNGFLDIISSSRDGQVRRSIIPPSGGKPQISVLHKHRGGVHKLVISPHHSSEVYSAGEDAFVRRKDLRSDETSTEFIKVMSHGKRSHKVCLYSIAHNPFAPEICVSGSDSYVRVYDKRNAEKVLHEMCPEHLVSLNTLATMPQVTCAVYNDSGTEILASYSDDHIYLFDNKNFKAGKFLHQYRGHYNHRTIKGVNFFGPRSEYVISGSDCGHIFYWDKNTEAIVNFMPGDNMGVVNCLESHPSIPVLATSGLDSNIKIWTPSSETYPPDLSKLEDCVKHNLNRSVMDDTNQFDDRQFQYFIRQFLRGPRGNAHRGGSGNGDQNEDNSSPSDPHILSSSSSSSSSDSDEDDDDDDDDDNNVNYSNLEGIHCRTQ